MVIWKHNRTRKFYGHPYMSPTSRGCTIQQLGLTITKAFALRLHTATTQVGFCPTHQNPLSYEPPEFDLYPDDGSLDGNPVPVVLYD
mmetsp:Transcript_4148/g.9309  ORF Transcript_4148/g.9309 Transcript_4148/m.9309 type:complete len:87 (+) Transcript_4148:107-367(+)